jgi:hypothetical protein
MDAEELLLSVNSGKKLSKSEIEEVHELLNTFWSNESTRKISLDEVYAFLQLISRARLLELRKVVETFLESKDGLTAALSLEILCLDWNLTHEYIQEVISFALGQSWDEEGDVQEIALKVLGEWLAVELAKNSKKKSPKILEKHTEVISLLLNIFNDTELSDWTRKICYFALCRAGGMAEQDLPSPYADLELCSSEPKIDSELIARLTELAAQSSSLKDSRA